MSVHNENEQKEAVNQKVENDKKSTLLEFLRSESEFWKNAFNVLLLAMFVGLIYVYVQVSGQRVELSVLQTQSEQLRELQKEVAGQNATLANLKTDLARVQDQAAQLTAMKVELGELKSSYEVYNVEFVDQREEVTTLRNKVSLMEQVSATLQTGINTAARDEQRLHNHIDELTAANTRTSERLAAIEARLSTPTPTTPTTPVPTAAPQ